jgi:hypothetical protein
MFALVFPENVTDWLPVDPAVVSGKSIHAAASPLLREFSIVPSLAAAKVLGGAQHAGEHQQDVVGVAVDRR